MSTGSSAGAHQGRSGWDRRRTSRDTSTSLDGGNEDQVEVTITNGFWMMRTEMTQELFEALAARK